VSADRRVRAVGSTERVGGIDDLVVRHGCPRYYQ
jgi:hypothetical protein